MVHFLSSSDILKFQALVWIHRFFSVSLLVFFILWHASSTGNLSPASKVRRSKWTIILYIKMYAHFLIYIWVGLCFDIQASASNSTLFEDEKLTPSQEGPVRPSGWSNHGWFYVIVRISLFLWVWPLPWLTSLHSFLVVTSIDQDDCYRRLHCLISWRYHQHGQGW